MHSKVIHMLSQLRVFQPHMPGLCSAHRNIRFSAHLVQVSSHLLQVQVFSQQGFVAHNQADYVVGWAVGHTQQTLKFFFIGLQVGA